MSSVEYEIAEKMVDSIETLAISGAVAAHQVVARRSLDSMVAGTVYIDVLPVGLVSEMMNRRNWSHSWTVHVAVRGKIGTGNPNPTPAEIQPFAIIRQQIQFLFEGANHRKYALSDRSVNLIGAQPFTLIGRQALEEIGCFIAPIEFTWLEGGF